MGRRNVVLNELGVGACSHQPGVIDGAKVIVHVDLFSKQQGASGRMRNIRYPHDILVHPNRHTSQRNDNLDKQSASCNHIQSPERHDKEYNSQSLPPLTSRTH